jgi:hypothetical protein
MLDIARRRVETRHYDPNSSLLDYIFEQFPAVIVENARLVVVRRAAIRFEELFNLELYGFGEVAV